MHVVVVTGSLLLLAGCGAEMLSGFAPETQSCDVTTVGLTVEPYVVIRDDAIELTVTWTTTDLLQEPVIATLHVGPADAVQVEMPLARQLTPGDAVYFGSQLNPFGSGAPSGAGWILSEASVPGCLGALSATANFELQ